MSEFAEFVIPVHTEDLLQDGGGGSHSNRLFVTDDVRVSTLGAPAIKKLLDGKREQEKTFSAFLTVIF
jgi:hypothetical protein